MRAAFLCQDLLPAFFGVARGGCSLSGWCLRCLRCLRCLPVSPGVSGEIRSDFSRFSRFSRFPPALRIILFSFPVCCPPSVVFPLADSRSSPYCPGKIAPPRSETAPKTRPCVDFAPFCLLYSIIFCNMDLLSARVVTARTDGTGHAEPDVFRRICIMAAGGCDNCSLRRESFYRHTDRFGM